MARPSVSDQKLKSAPRPLAQAEAVIVGGSVVTALTTQVWQVRRLPYWQALWFLPWLWRGVPHQGALVWACEGARLALGLMGGGPRRWVGRALPLCKA